MHLQSTWGGTGSNPYADEFLPCHAGLFGNEYLRAVADASWLRALESKASLDIANCHLRNFETLAAAGAGHRARNSCSRTSCRRTTRTFSIVTARSCASATISDQFEFQKRLWEDREAYVEQLQYVNRRIGEVVDRLITTRPRPPVILLVSDHGPNLRQGMNADEERHVRLSNLTAMYLPGAPAGYLPPTRRPVNHLRRVFNLYFDASLPILPDRYFISSSERPFDLREVGLNNDRWTNEPVLTKCDGSAGRRRPRLVKCAA